jgi:hypothetical protein
MDPMVAVFFDANINLFPRALENTLYKFGNISITTSGK